MSPITRYVTRPQIETVQHFNSRSSREPLLIGGYRAPEGATTYNPAAPGWYLTADAVEIVDVDDKRADMIGGVWFGITIGILPDGSSHS